MPTPESQGNRVYIPVRVVDLEGRPLAGLYPIATTKPNAFDAPVAKGAPTDQDGRASITVPNDRWLYVRAWDPARKWFANNYYDVLPGGGSATDELEIVMAPAAALEAQVLGPDGRPLANEFVGIMMSHPTRGPWWPAEARTNESGRIRFDDVPPGTFLITLESRAGRQLEIPNVSLDPKGNTDLGTVQLQ